MHVTARHFTRAYQRRREFTRVERRSCLTFDEANGTIGRARGERMTDRLLAETNTLQVVGRRRRREAAVTDALCVSRASEVAAYVERVSPFLYEREAQTCLSG